MTEHEITKALVSYRLIEEQKAKLEAEQKELKKKIEAHMKDNKLETIEANDVVASFVTRMGYKFDVRGIAQHVPEVLDVVTLSNENFERLLKGHEKEIGHMRESKPGTRSLTIRGKRDTSA